MPVIAGTPEGLKTAKAITALLAECDKQPDHAGQCSECNGAAMVELLFAALSKHATKGGRA